MNVKKFARKIYKKRIILRLVSFCRQIFNLFIAVGFINSVNPKRRNA